MTDCPICKQVPELTLFETEHVRVLAHPKPAVAGHLLVIPKHHAPILEAVPDAVVQELFTVANAVSTKLFDGLRAQGTNILVQNGLPAGQSEPHVVLHVIPRGPKDGLDFTWKMEKANEGDLKTTAETLKGGVDSVGVVQKEKPKPKEKKIEEKEVKDDDLEFRHLERIP